MGRNQIKYFWYAAILLMAAVFVRPAQAQLTIEITGGAAVQIPIALVPFAGERTQSTSMTAIIAADLQRSGLFKIIDSSSVFPAPHQPSEVRIDDWKSRGAAALVIGNIVQRPDNSYEAQFRLIDTVRQDPLNPTAIVQLTGKAVSFVPAQLRQTAHQIADIIYEKLTGDVGVFSTRIAYITKSGHTWELQVADADGYGSQSLVKSSEPLMSPAWSPDGTHLAYVSFEKRKPVIFVQSLMTGKRQLVANFRGNNSAPAWSPDGSQLAIVLSKDGNSQIYIINANGAGLRRLTHSGAIDTEPSWSPDGRYILFTSDRGGSPQIYRIPATGGDVARMTFDGSYNVTPRYSPDGNSFAFVTNDGGRFRVALQDIQSGQVQVLTDTSLDESPSFAPNGKMILYATVMGGRNVLAAVSSDGRVRQRLTTSVGEVKGPAWGPLPKR